MKGLFLPKWFCEHSGFEVYSCSHPQEQESTTMPAPLQHLYFSCKTHSQLLCPPWHCICPLAIDNCCFPLPASHCFLWPHSQEWKTAFLRLISFICCVLCRSLLRARSVHGNWEVKGKTRRLETGWGKCLCPAMNLTGWEAQSSNSRKLQKGKLRETSLEKRLTKGFSSNSWAVQGACIITCINSNQKASSSKI